MSVPMWSHSISPVIPMVSHARPSMQWALVGAKRLECGSLLPLCFYAQTTCLEPDRHDVANNVSVPLSVSWLKDSELGRPELGSMRAMPQSGGKTRTTSLSPYFDSPPKVVPW